MTPKEIEKLFNHPAELSAKTDGKGAGVQGRRLDIAVAGTHEDALKWDGYGNHRVWVIEGSDGDE